MIKVQKASEFQARRPIRGTAPASIAASVAEIISDVKNRGDIAVRELTEKWDGCAPETIEVGENEIEAAINAVGDSFMAVMKRAAENISEYHSKQIRQGFVMTKDNGIVLGQRILPINRVGIYVPGGTASYPSTVLMNAIPAKLAGVNEIAIATPPMKDGRVNAMILAAARLSGADRIYKMGGAQAIAAMAFGTETINRVDKITGPGNAYVAEAKRQVFGIVGIDMIAGPSDILVIADEKADPVLVAADMLSQCEHGEDSIAVLVTDSKTLADKTQLEIEKQLSALPREKTARESIESNGRIILVDSLDEAFEISNELAPEHLEIFLEEPFSYLGMIRNAGSVFLGKNTPEAVGDYYAGPNHTIPTSSTAWFSSPLSIDDFQKKMSFSYYTADALRLASDDIAKFAKEEGFDAHALSVTKRIK